jgi:hypothetical protein
LDAIDAHTGRHGVRRADVTGALVCALTGLLMAVLPHLLWLPQVGAPFWLADFDEAQIYLPVAAHSYYQHPWSLTDTSRRDDAPTMYPWLQMAPGILAARVIGAGPMWIGFFWRAWAGLTIGLFWYALVRTFVSRPGVAAALALMPLVDPSQLLGFPLARVAIISAQTLVGRRNYLDDLIPSVFPQWRVITPGLSQAYLLLFLLALGRARQAPRPGRVLAAGLALGLNFYIYFFNWTALVVGLALAVLFDRRGRRVLLAVGFLGLLAGLPAVVRGYLLKATASPDWGPRTDLWLHIPRGSELILNAHVLLPLVAAAAGLVWATRRRDDQAFVWAAALGGLLMINHQLVTGLQLQNHHYYYVAGPALYLGFLLLIHEVVRDRPAARRALYALVGLLAVFGCATRAAEGLATRGSRVFMGHFLDYRAQAARSPHPFAPNEVIAGDDSYLNMAGVFDDLRPLDSYTLVVSMTTGNDEWDERGALNEYLLGVDREEFEKKLEERFQHGATLWGPWSRDDAAAADRRARRLAAYDRVAADLDAALSRHAVAYVALPRGRHPAYLDRGWEEVCPGPTWDVWRYRGAAAQSPRPLRPIKRTAGNWRCIASRSAYGTSSTSCGGSA